MGIRNLAVQPKTDNGDSERSTTTLCFYSVLKTCPVLHQSQISGQSMSKKETKHASGSAGDHKSIVAAFVCMIVVVLFGQIFADTGSVIAVISPRQTIDARPILWQNFDSDDPLVQILFFRGERYDFIGLINGEDSTRVFSGLNTAGFGIVVNMEADSSIEPTSAALVKKALGTCDNINDFVSLWQAESAYNSATAFACIDAYGGAELFDATGRRLADDPINSPQGFLVRTDFTFVGSHKRAAGLWRYHRSHELLGPSDRTLSVRSILQEAARDVQTMSLDPYPLPFTGRLPGAADGYISSSGCINQFNTRACIVICGVRPRENPDFATLWAVLGEPLCGVAVPMWPATGESPVECRGTRGALNSIIRSNERLVYDKKDMPAFFNTVLYAEKNRGLLPRLLKVENSIYKETQKALATWPNQDDYINNMIILQSRLAARAARSIRY